MVELADACAHLISFGALHTALYVLRVFPGPDAASPPSPTPVPSSCTTSSPSPVAGNATGPLVLLPDW
jgi:hypothetical protein